MTQAESASSTKGKGKAFFERAEQVATTGNWDFAIELYLEGIQREPDNVEEGHKPLREVSLKRKAQGGGGPGLVEQVKRRPGRDPLTNLVDAECLLAKDPGSVAYMEQVFRAAHKLALPGVVKWICDILLESQRLAKKPSKRILQTITQAFDEQEEYARGVAACDLALQVAPNDGELINLQRNLSAKYTIQAGKYDKEGDFTRSVKNLEEQQELMRKDELVKDEGFLLKEVERTKHDYLEMPKVAGKINADKSCHLRAVLLRVVEVLRTASRLPARKPGPGLPRGCAADREPPATVRVFCCDAGRAPHRGPGGCPPGPVLQREPQRRWPEATEQHRPAHAVAP